MPPFPRPPSPPSLTGLEPRLAAARALTVCEADPRAKVGDVLDDLTQGFDPRDAALARELALGALRHRRLYDHLADRFLKNGGCSSRLRPALRIGAHQLFALDRVPAPAAVGTAVAAARYSAGDGLSGLANAVLRRLAGLRTPRRGAPGPLGRLASEDQPLDPLIRHSLPGDLLTRLRSALPAGLAEDAALAALNQPPPLCTRTRPGATVGDRVGVVRRDGPWQWWEEPSEALRGPVADGRATVQDRAQGRTIEACAPQAGERALDICAAPGGKALALHDAGCQVTACDVSPAKAAGLRRDLPPGIAVVCADGARPPLAAGSFDLVLVDAPCSNTGVLARRPEAKWRFSAASLAELAGLQTALLAGAAPLVKPGGRLAYATCSLIADENRAIAAALPGWRIVREALHWPDAWQAGGYVAVLERLG